MSFPRPTFESGDPVAKALNATFLNAIVDRLALAQPQSTNRPVGGFDKLSTITAEALNGSGSDLDERSVLSVTTIAFSITDDWDAPSFQRRPLLSVDIPDSVDNFPAIALEPILDGMSGRVAIGGIAVCTIDVINTGHQFATPTPADESMMTSADSGPARIIWKDTGTGEKTAVVYLGGGAGGSGGCAGEMETLCFVTDASIACNAGTVTLSVTKVCRQFCTTDAEAPMMAFNAPGNSQYIPLI